MGREHFNSCGMSIPTGICTGMCSTSLSIHRNLPKKRAGFFLLFCVHLQSCVIAKAVLLAAHCLPLCNFFPQNKVAVMTWRAWAMCSCISTWARCPGRASRLPPSAKSMRGSVRKRCRHPLKCSAKGTLVSALILMTLLSGVWLALLLKPHGVLSLEGQCPVPPDQDVLLTPVMRRIRDQW